MDVLFTCAAVVGADAACGVDGCFYVVLHYHSLGIKF